MYEQVDEVDESCHIDILRLWFRDAFNPLVVMIDGPNTNREVRVETLRTLCMAISYSFQNSVIT